MSKFRRKSLNTRQIWICCLIFFYLTEGKKKTIIIGHFLDGVFMNAKVEALLKSKPAKEVIFASVSLSKDYWKKSCEQQNALVKKQREENQKLIPDSKLYKTPFSL